MRIAMIILVILIGHEMSADTPRLYGKLRDSETKQPIEFATIAVKHIVTDSLITAVISDFKGEFILEVKSGKYKMQIRCLGYETIDMQIEANKMDVYLKTIEMRFISSELEGVDVVGSSYHEQYDKSIQNITKEFKDGTSKALDLLTKIRGVNVDPLDNSIKVDNGNNTLLLVNGLKKEQSYIKNIPPDRIERIEITRNPTGRFISSGYSSVINIILKKNYAGYDLLVEDQGLFSLDKSNGDDFLFKNTATANLTYTIKSINLYSAYSNQKSNTNLPVEYMSIIDDTKLVKSSPTNAPNMLRDDFSNTYLLGFDYYINSKQSISLETKVIHSPMDRNGSSQSFFNKLYSDNGGEAFYSLLSKDNYSNDQYSLLSYRNEISEKSRVEIDYSYNFSKSEMWNSYSEADLELNSQFVKSKRNTSIFDVNFNHSFSSTYSVEAGYRNTYRDYDYSIILPENKKVDNTEKRNIAYAYISITPKSKIRSKLGFATEHNGITSHKQTKNYYSLQPFVNVFYNQSKNINLTLKLSSASNYPFVSQINPTEVTNDRITSEVGNPDLRLATKYAGSLDIKLLNNKFSIEPFYSITKNHISLTGNIVDDHFRYSYSNLDKYVSRGFNMSTRMAIIPRKMSLNLSCSLYFDKTEFDGYTNKVNDFSMNGNLMYHHAKYKTLYALMLKKMNVKQIQAYGYYSNDNDYLGLFVKQAFFKQRLNTSLLYILPVDFGFKYSMKDYFASSSFKETNKADVEILTNLFMLKVSFNINRGKESKTIEKNSYKEKEQSKGFF